MTVPIKRAKVYASWRNTLTYLSDSASNLATSSQDKIEEIFSQFSFPRTATLHTHEVVQSCSLQKEENILIMENLHNKQFNNLCGVADWLIISRLNAILPCASS